MDSDANQISTIGEVSLHRITDQVVGFASVVTQQHLVT